jgi:hypothetical protein
VSSRNEPADSARAAPSKSPRITTLGAYPSRTSPTDSAEEPEFVTPRSSIRAGSGGEAPSLVPCREARGVRRRRRGDCGFLGTRPPEVPMKHPRTAEELSSGEDVSLLKATSEPLVHTRNDKFISSSGSDGRRGIRSPAGAETSDPSGPRPAEVPRDDRFDYGCPQPGPP